MKGHAYGFWVWGAVLVAAVVTTQVQAQNWLHPNGSLLVTDAMYTNPSVSQDDGGDYTCEASNSRGMVTQSVTITVEVPPPAPTSVIPSPTSVIPSPTSVLPSPTQAMTSPSPTPSPAPTPEGPPEVPEVTSVDGPTSVREGDTLQLTCVATGSPPPTIEWLHPNGSLVGTEAIYTDPSFSQSDEGNYTCVASNSRGESTQTFPVRLALGSSNVGLIVLLSICSSLAAIFICVTFIMLGFCCSEIQRRDSLKRLRSTSTADELQLIEEAVDEGVEGDGSPELLAETSARVNKAFIEDESGEELKPSPAAQKDEDREALYKVDPQQHARHVTSSSSKGRGKADSKAKKPKQTKAGTVPYNALVEDPRAKEQRPNQRQRGSSSGSHGVVVFDPRLSHEQQQQIIMLQQQQQMKALQHQQRAQTSRASMPPEVLLAHERERREGKPGSTAATRERKGSKQRDPRERMSAPVGAVPSQEKKGSKHKAASGKAPAPVPVVPMGAIQRQKGKKKKNEKIERPASPRSQPEGSEDRQTEEPTPEEVRMKEVETVAQRMPIAAAQASEPSVTTFKTREQDRHGDGDQKEEDDAIRTTSIVISERTGETVVAMEQEAPDLTELSGGEEEGLGPSASEEEEEEEVGGASGGKEEDKQRLLPAKGEKEDMKEDPNVTRMSVFIEKAKKMGRPVSIIQQLDRSHPLNLAQVQEMLESEASHEHSLTVEYKSVPHNSIQSLQQPLAESQKNRYRNVLPNPHSSVKLRSTGEDGSTYINANFVRGYGGKENRYIVTQGPFASTIPDFWRMVWEQNISIIVMITGLVERSKHKCAKYWPEADSLEPATYGEMVVRNNFEEKSAAYKVSYLSVYPKDQDEDAVEEREIYHFWYTAWPDFGVPSESAPSLRLRETVNSFQNPDSGPILVHCSAGLGRSGTFMAIDMGVQQYEQEGVVDPLKYMCEMRQDRGGTIQTAEQYVFIHRALADYMASKPK